MKSQIHVYSFFHSLNDHYDISRDSYSEHKLAYGEIYTNLVVISMYYKKNVPIYNFVLLNNHIFVVCPLLQILFEAVIVRQVSTFSIKGIPC